MELILDYTCCKMPWNCLCSNTSKKEKRPQISAPILHIDEESDKKPQIQPRLINAEALEQRLADIETPNTVGSPSHDTVDHISTENQNLLDENTPDDKVKGSKKKSKESKKAAKKLKKEEKAKSKKKLKEKSKNQSNNKNHETNSDEALNLNEKREIQNADKQFTHVQFSFDDYSGLDLTEQKPSSEEDEIKEISPIPPQKPARGEIIQIHKNDLNGNYDELPLIQIIDENNRNYTPSLEKESIINRSNESIPFIDDEAQSQTIQRKSPQRNNFHDTRIITLIPKNLESHHLNCNPNQNVLQTFMPIPKLRYEPQLQQFKQVHILPKIEEQGGQENGMHKFQYYYNPGVKICQICHLYLHVCPAIKCFECEFTCHQECFHKSDRKRNKPNWIFVERFSCTSNFYMLVGCESCSNELKLCLMIVSEMKFFELISIKKPLEAIKFEEFSIRMGIFLI
uniref:CSON014461 protein n=1 Tax=Culicoides sonorensis TaxID=179676 RepID=A0A336MAT5_CULSO